MNLSSALPVVLAAFAAFAAASVPSPASAAAFVGVPPAPAPPAPRSDVRSASWSTATAAPPLRMSDLDEWDDLDGDDGDDGDDDALSKLIGKRDFIRKTAEDKAKGPSGPKPDEEIVDPVAVSSAASPKADAAAGGDEGGAGASSSSSDLDLDLTGWDYEEMPEFKTKRPLRSSKKSSSSEEERKKKEKEEEEEGGEINFIDYMADYEDENEFHVTNRMGFGTGAWGDERRGFSSKKKLKKKDLRGGMYLAGDLQMAYNTLLESGVTFVDTSESYGSKMAKKSLSAEHILGRCIDDNPAIDPLVASTFANPWMHILNGGGVRSGRRSVVKALEQTCERLGTSSIELYQVPAALYLGFPNALADGLSDCLDRGLCNYVGVTNMGKYRMRSMARKMERRGASLTSNQFAFSLTNRKAWKSGLISACKDLGVVPFAHTPLDGGLATGLYTNTNPSGGKAGGNFPYDLKKLNRIQPLTGMMETVQSKVKSRLQREKRDEQSRMKGYRDQPMGNINTDPTTTQIALNYVVAKGCVPIPGIKTVAQAEEVLGCLGWGLTEEEVQLLDSAADAVERGIKL